MQSLFVFLIFYHLTFNIVQFFPFHLGFEFNILVLSRIFHHNLEWTLYLGSSKDSSRSFKATHYAITIKIKQSKCSTRFIVVCQTSNSCLWTRWINSLCHRKIYQGNRASLETIPCFLIHSIYTLNLVSPFHWVFSISPSHL